MNRKILLAICLILGIFLGWGIGYLRIPEVQGKQAFWVGVLFGLGFFLFITSVGVIYNRNLNLAKWIFQKSYPNDPNIAFRNLKLIWLLLTGIILFGGLFLGGFFYTQKVANDRLVENQNMRIREIMELTESIRNGNQLSLMSSLLVSVEEELKSNKNRTLSEATIKRVSALCQSFKPYRYLINDSLSTVKLSPERGQLLVNLLLMNIDSTSFSKLKKQTSFAHSDLRGVRLNGVDLSGIDLSFADLSEANFSDANFSKASLQSANLRGANCDRANFDSTVLRHAYLGYLQANKARFTNANLNGTNMEQAQFQFSNLSSSLIQYSQMKGALFNNANFTKSDLVRSDLSRANTTQANFTEARFFKVVVNESIMKGAIFDDAEVHAEWKDQFKTSQVDGEMDILNRYQMVADSTNKQAVKYYLKRN